LWPGLLSLLQAHDYAQQTGRDGWDFAVEIAELRRRGMTNADCRWLVCNGWARLGRELRARPGERRRFRHDISLAISRGTCLVLMPAGQRVAAQIAARGSLPRVDGVDTLLSDHVRQIVPHWDSDRRELRLGSRLVKRFKLPAPNQEMILTVLEEESWPRRIDDPLSPSKLLDAKRRLHDTIKYLNRNQKHRLLRFIGDGTGQGVRWELIA
jgi:hypothetical protein